MFFLLIYWDCNSVFLLAAVAEPTGPKKLLLAYLQQDVEG